MLYILACFPIIIPYVCGLVPGILVAVLTSPVIVLYGIYGRSITPEMQSFDFAVCYTSTGLVALYFALICWSIFYIRYETYFDTLPWRTNRDAMDQRKCPYTGLAVNRRCPSCDCQVNKNAFEHQKNTFLLEFGGMQEALLWTKAKACIKSTDIDQGRQNLDTVLGFTGNATTLTVASCCIGCSTWQTVFNVGRRMTMTYALASLFFAYTPLAFTAFIETVGTAGLVLKTISLILSQIFAASAFALELKGFSKAALFLIRNPLLPRPEHLKHTTQQTLMGKLLHAYSM